MGRRACFRSIEVFDSSVSEKQQQTITAIEMNMGKIMDGNLYDKIDLIVIHIMRLFIGCLVFLVILQIYAAWLLVLLNKCLRYLYSQ